MAILKEFLGVIKNFIYKFFNKEKNTFAHPEKIVKNISRKGVKDVFTGDDSLSISGGEKLLKEQINTTARKIIRKSYKKPEILLNYVESKGAVIVKSKHMERILKLLSEELGFITPMTGIRALVFSVLINRISPVKLKIGFKTPAMFALKDEPVNIYTLSHQFHLWMSYINDLPGFEEGSMSKFRKFWNADPETVDMKTLSVEQMFALKDIISREMEALDFVKEMAREIVGQRKSIKRLKEGKAVNL